MHELCRIFIFPLDFPRFLVKVDKTALAPICLQDCTEFKSSDPGASTRRFTDRGVYGLKKMKSKKPFHFKRTGVESPLYGMGTRGGHGHPESYLRFPTTGQTSI
jgi:hypothetical protein